ncbi:lipopolysaccharide export system protein LptA [Sinobacterium caligoides]|uniref:Lipopolysaccharide export system protein LptA n=1 Tax=Sinobacterium caligoides TaxID=933926 RepID=A0A3N2E2E6_9GAMM|nr:lipopolysaccharide transport periplasmic protein LptA [Sinobacterium caligoides]ROS06112.1 lipopolysaccharide export system protein LptA [Sinobacterium caligoides]
MRHNRLALSSLLLCLCLSSIVNALPSDRNQPIHIYSDRLERDEKTAVTTYIGNVKLDQGSLHITADKLVIYQANGDLSKIQAIGKPAHLQQLPEVGQQIVYAQGEVIDYFSDKDLLILTKNASITQDGTLVKSERIEYLISEEIIKAKGSAEATSGDDRVHVVIPPSQTNNKAHSAPEKTPEQPSPSQPPLSDEE